MATGATAAAAYTGGVAGVGAGAGAGLGAASAAAGNAVDSIVGEMLHADASHVTGISLAAAPSMASTAAGFTTGSRRSQAGRVQAATRFTHMAFESFLVSNS